VKPSADDSLVELVSVLSSAHTSYTSSYAQLSTFFDLAYFVAYYFRPYYFYLSVTVILKFVILVDFKEFSIGQLLMTFLNLQNIK
jgi:hypothetical protein